MLAATIQNPIPLPSIAPAFVHIVTLINRMTGDERTLEVVTLSDRFADVMREINAIKAEQKLLGYEVFETIDCNDPF